ncbi:MAG: SIMPL domain-containing protein [Deinococcales bacterium]
MNNTLGNFLGMLALAAAIVIGAFLASNSIKESRADADITVTGSARKAITSDLVQWKGSISAESSNLQAAAAELKKNVERLRQFVTQNSSDIKLELAPISSESLTYERTNIDGSRQTIPGWRVRQRVQVESDQVQEVTALAAKTAENMLSNGIPFEADLSYLYTKLADLRIQMLEEATSDAKKRAEVIAKGAGVGIGAPRNARVGVFQITPKNNPSVDDYGAFDTSSIEKEITAVVSVAFVLR